MYRVSRHNSSNYFLAIQSYLVILQFPVIHMYLAGTQYVHTDNSIGLNVNQSKKEDVSEIISFIKANHKPLPSVKSIRRGDFFMNVSSDNGDLIKCLQQLGKEEIQRSFVV